jgi:hypothetical protein
MKWTIVIGILFGCLVVVAQQQFSGGQAVTVSNFPGTQPVSGTFWQATQPVSIASMPSTPVTGTFWQATQPVSGTVSVNALPAGTAKIGTTYPYTSCGTTAFTKALQAMPTSSTAIASSTTCLLSLQVSNTTGGSLTVTVSDNQGTPINFLNGVTILAGESRQYNFPNGANFTTGIKVQASGAGITYAAEGLQ